MIDMAWVAQHKWWIAGGIVAVGVIYIVSQESGTSADSTGLYSEPSDASIQAAANLQAMQLQVGSQNQANQLAYQANAENNAAQIQLAQIQAHTQDNANTLAAGVASQQITAAQAVQINQDTLAAQVQENNNATQLGIISTIASNQTQQTSMIASALVQQSQIQAQVQQFGLASANYMALLASQR